jgi:uncharacterized membrane protein YuzA (DUF378 family)
MDPLYARKKLYMFGLLLLVIGGLNWGIMALTGNDVVSKLFGRGSTIAKAIFFLVALSAVLVVFRRDFYLPFLGETHIPCSVLKETTPESADTTMTVQVTPRTKVIYWAAEPAEIGLKELNNYEQAYKEYKNAGVAVSDDLGNAVLSVRSPQPYTVPMKGALPSHIHYRVCGERGFMGPVKTITLSGAELFTNPSYNPEEEINTVVSETLANNLMVQSDALVEGPIIAGAPFQDAF